METIPIAGGRGSLRRIWRVVVRDLVPRSSSALSEQTWIGRHRAIRLLLWVHVAGVPLFGLVTGHGVAHTLTEGTLIALAAVGAGLTRLSRTGRAVMATLGLLLSSAVLVHFSGGMIEMHFHFFVVVAMVTLYQSWQVFLLAIGFVLTHHALAGVIAPSSVYNHPAAIANPWKWALIHALFIGAESFVGLVAWKVSETAARRERAARDALERANADLAEAQTIAHVGSWDWDVIANRVAWSDELYRIMGFERENFQPDYEAFFKLVHPDDRDAFKAIVDQSYESHENFEGEFRIVRPDREVRVLHVLGAVTVDAEGAATKMVGTAQDVTERRRLEEQLKHQAVHDPLTGLPNRVLFTDRVQHSLDRLQRNPGMVAVLFIDLDNFKDVNDGLGHAAGDQLLRTVAGRLKASLRTEDSAARLGGDEFAVLIEDVDESLAAAIARRFLATLPEPLSMHGQEIIVGASIGIAFGHHHISADEVLRNADTAMYEAKRRGRNRYAIFDERMDSRSTERIEMQADLSRALDAGEIVLQYQPVYRLDPLHIVGVEALVRWRHPRKGMIAPGKFIALAEETGSIVPLGNKVLDLACAHLGRWNRTLGRANPLRCGINFSGRQLGAVGFVESVEDALLRHGVMPQQLMIEITETVLMQEPDAVAKRLQRLTDLGVVLAIDDFGTGYSSLGYLRRFPVKVLKLDRYFVRGIDRGPEESGYAKAIVKLGHNLGIDVVAEGIETPGELEELRAMGADFGQGFLFADAMDADDLEAILRLEPGLESVSS